MDESASWGGRDGAVGDELGRGKWQGQPPQCGPSCRCEKDGFRSNGLDQVKAEEPGLQAWNQLQGFGEATESIGYNEEGILHSLIY